LLAVATGLLFSVMPALHAAREATGEVLQQTGRSGVGGRSQARDMLVIGQVAAAVMLLVGAGLLLRTFERLQTLELGFNPQRLITMRTQLPNPKYLDPTSRLAFYERVVDLGDGPPGRRAGGLCVTGAVPEPGEHDVLSGGRADCD
jgi:putative ABC transport system permease protein